MQVIRCTHQLMMVFAIGLYALPALAQPGWRDTVIVPREGSITFRARFLDFPGKTVLHCHKMNHEELGMMQVIEFVAEQ